jgi:hypothetical protein
MSIRNPDQRVGIFVDVQNLYYSARVRNDKNQALHANEPGPFDSSASNSTLLQDRSFPADATEKLPHPQWPEVPSRAAGKFSVLQQGTVRRTAIERTGLICMQRLILVIAHPGRIVKILYVDKNANALVWVSYAHKATNLQNFYKSTKDYKLFLYRL